MTNFRQIFQIFAARFPGVFAEIEATGVESEKQ